MDDYKDYPFDRDDDAYETITAIRNEQKSVGYRPQWVADILDKRSILSCALDVHMTTTGSYERSREDQLKDVKVLTYIADNWRESLKFTKRFDDAVLGVLITALQEFALAEVATMTR